MRFNLVLNVQINVVCPDDTNEDIAEAAAWEFVESLDLGELVELERPDPDDHEVSFTIGLDGEPVETEEAPS